MLLRGELKFQFETFRGAKAFHENLPLAEAVDRIAEQMTDVFCQLQLQAAAGQVTALVSKKGKSRSGKAGSRRKSRAGSPTGRKSKTDCACP